MLLAPAICMIFILICHSISSGESVSIVLDEANLESSTLTMFGADQSGTSLGFRVAGIEVESVDLNGTDYQAIKLLTENPEFFGDTAEEGLPELPVYAHLIGIPDYSGARIEIISSSYEILDGYEIMPSQPPVLESSVEQPPFTINDDFYGRDEFYPSEPVQLGEPVICRDLRMIQVVISPVQYNPLTRQIKVYTNLDYNVVYEGYDQRNVKSRRGNTIAESFMSLYRAMVPNADELLAAYEPIRGGYLIITPDAFEDSAAVLGRWKHLKGYNMVIATGSDIDPNGSTPTAVEVKNYIQDAYDTWDIPPEYICIIGDENLAIPDYEYDYGYDTYASDHPYSCVDGDDYLSDIMVTRMSVNSSYQTLSVTMHKALTYEMNPYMSDPDHWRRGLSVAGNVYAVTPRLTVLWVRHQLLNHGFTHVDTSFRWSSGQSDPYLLGYFNSGPCLVSYRGWAGPSGWYSPSFSTSDLNSIQNHNMLAPMASIVCGTGHFGYSECFGEKWIRMGSSPTSNKGGPAFFGSTDTGTHTKWNNPIMIGYYWAILRENISNFALAAFYGKLNQYNKFPSHNYPGGNIEKYHHTYNTLGEPELEVRTMIPRSMTVSYPSSVPVGTNVMEIQVDGQGGAPLTGAYVNLVKGYGVEEEVFVGGRTGNNGLIILDFSAPTPDTLFVTVTAKDYIPHVGYSLVQTAPVAVGVNSIALDDDNSGNSSGNSDGNVNPAETVEFDVVLRNYGSSITATDVQATLSSSNPYVEITIASQSFGDIAPGNTASSGKFAAQFSPYSSQGEHIILDLLISSDQGSWDAAIPVDVKSMHFLHLGTSYPDNPNGRPDPGETTSMVVSLQNQGELAGSSLIGNITQAYQGITIIDGSADFGDIGIGEIGSNASSPFIIEIASDVYNGYSADLGMELVSSSGAVASTNIPIVIGNVSTYDPVGPDEYGYFMYDDTDTGYDSAPIHQWMEISPYAGGSGARVNFPFSTDDDAAVVLLPFDFVYHGQAFDYMLVCINGFVAFDTSTYDMEGHRFSNSHNMSIPDYGAPSGIICPFWDDLEYYGNSGVFEYYDSSSNRFIIEWKNCVHARTGDQQSFQMIIYDPVYHSTPTGDSEILFQYQVVNNTDDNSSGSNPGLYSTVGLQNLENSDGLQYTFDNYYHPGAATLTNGRAIKVTTATGLGMPTPGACCLPDESCIEDLTPLECQNLSGTFMGENTLCSEVDCTILDIPTLSEWGMLIMGLLLLAVGTIAVVMRKRIALNRST
jgi:hypothetical protein